MVVKTFYRRREDRKRLFISLDVLTDENGKPVRDSRGRLVPSGFKIQKYIVLKNGERVKKDDPYSYAIDVEGVPYEYVTTDILIKEVKNNE